MLRRSSCGRFQQIPHPMWRYQSSPDAFGTASWACHGACCDYTRWRVVDATRVPDDHAPESWGRAEAQLDRVRAIRRDELAAADGGV